jgi:nucleoside-diphosphate-sugar epimerase
MYLLNSRDLEILTNKINFEWLRNKSVLITGASGMLGSYLVESIIRGCDQAGVSFKKIKLTSKMGSFQNLKHMQEDKRITYVKHEDYNLEDADSFEVIIHAGSPSNITKFGSVGDLLESNLTFVESHNFSSVENFCFFSTSEVYSIQKEISESDICKKYSLDRNSYPEIKLVTERKIREKFASRDVKISLPRIFHTFGPGLRENDGRSFGDFIFSVSKGAPPCLFSEGLQKRTFLYTLDFVIAIMSQIDIGSDVAFDIGSDKIMTIRDFAITVSEVGGLDGVINQNSSPPSGFVPSQNSQLIPDLAFLRSAGWSESTSVELAIEQTLGWISRKY